MDFFIAAAYADGTAAQEPSLLGGLLPLILLFVIFYFLLIRPQQKKAKEHRNLVSGLSVGDEVVTLGGLAGRVDAVYESFIELAVNDTMVLTIQRDHIAQLLPKGSLSNVKTPVSETKEVPADKTED